MPTGEGQFATEASRRQRDSRRGSRAWLGPRPRPWSVAAGQRADGELARLRVLRLEEAAQHVVRRVAGLEKHADLGLAHLVVGLGLERRRDRGHGLRVADLAE